ncbi:hypothetical protein BH11PSE3_BH11PSE3_38800 [soil metagenome]
MSLGFIPTGGTADAYAQRLASETERWRKVIKSAGIQPPAQDRSRSTLVFS